MLHEIGKKPRSDDRDALDARLLDCHDRIRDMTALARRLAADPRPTGDEIGEAAARVNRYFSRSLQLHVRDEEDSIRPRLEAASPAAKVALDRMAREHVEHEPHVTSLVDACAELARDPSRWDSLRGVVQRAAEELDRLFASHLEEEEREVFPLLAALDESARAAIVDEMRARRDAEGGGGQGRRGGGGGGGGGGSGGGGGRGRRDA